MRLLYFINRVLLTLSYIAIIAIMFTIVAVVVTFVLFAFEPAGSAVELFLFPILQIFLN
jgi:hypothetical protein